MQAPPFVADNFHAGLSAPEGVYATFAVASEGAPVLLLAPVAGAPIAAVLPFDALFAERAEAALRLWRALTRPSRRVPTSPTAQQRRRLKLVVRALDGRLAGETYRAIAVGLFGASRVPGDNAWKTHPIRSHTIRLVADGLKLMRGGYLALLRPARRKR